MDKEDEVERKEERHRQRRKRLKQNTPQGFEDLGHEGDWRLRRGGIT